MFLHVVVKGLTMTRLVLTRREWETLVIDGACKVTIIRISRGHVKMTVEAEPSVTILRGEIADRMSRCPPTTDAGDRATA